MASQFFLELYQKARVADCDIFSTLVRFEDTAVPKTLPRAIALAEDISEASEDFFESMKVLDRDFSTPRSRQYRHVCPKCGRTSCINAVPMLDVGEIEKKLKDQGFNVQL